jgi:type II secretory pathway component GspD/PulD (secretin)
VSQNEKELSRAASEESAQIRGICGEKSLSAITGCATSELDDAANLRYGNGMSHSRFFFVIFGVTVLVSASLFGQKPNPSMPPDSKTSASERTATTASPSSPCKPVVDVCDVLNEYAALTHFRLIRDNFVQGRVYLDTTNLPREKAIDSIERTLLANGYQLVQVDPETVEIVGLGRNARSVGAQLISDPKDLPRGERVVSYVFKPKFADVTELQQALGQYLSPPQMYTSFIALPKENALVLTERTSVVRRVIEIISKIDVSPTNKTP